MKKTVKEQAKVVFTLSVAGRNPGTRPERLLKRIKMARVPTRSVNSLPRDPIFVLMSPERASTISSAKFLKVSFDAGMISLSVFFNCR